MAFRPASLSWAAFRPMTEFRATRAMIFASLRPALGLAVAHGSQSTEKFVRRRPTFGASLRPASFRPAIAFAAFRPRVITGAAFPVSILCAGVGREHASEQHPSCYGKPVKPIAIHNTKLPGEENENAPG